MSARIVRFLCWWGIHPDSYWVDICHRHCPNCDKTWYDNPYMYT
jgi:hypothetical protein